MLGTFQKMVSIILKNFPQIIALINTKDKLKT
jgi:hypothetical protein